MNLHEQLADAAALPQEIEYKFQIADEILFQSLLALERVDDFELQDAGVRQGQDVYSDTADYAFWRAGYACRLRPQRNGTWLATIKGLESGGDRVTGLHQRTELEIELPEPLAPTEWPESPARRLALTLLDEEPLQELVRIAQVRHVRRALRHGDAVAEVTLDAVDFQPHGDLVWFLELEQKGDHGADLEDLSRLLQADYPGLTPEPRSKLEIALSLAGIEPETPVIVADDLPAAELAKSESRQDRTPGVRSDDRMSEAGRKILRFHLTHMLRHETGTRKGDDIEDLHDMRVSTRRMRAAIKIFEPYFDEDAIKPFGRELRRIGRTLGRVRDLDVLQNKLQRFGTGLPAGEQAGLEQLAASWEVQREGARRAMLAYLESDRYRRFKKSFGGFLDTPGAGALPLRRDEPVRLLVCHVVPSTVWLDYEGIRAFEWVLNRAPLETLHALRIEIKGLRYLLEFFRDLMGDEVEAAIRSLVQVQDTLGDLNDAHVAIQLLSDFLRQVTGLPEGRARTLPDMHGVALDLSHQEAQVRNLQRRVPLLWKQLNHPKLRRQIGLAVARL